jgi:hypothetical protein
MGQGKRAASVNARPSGGEAAKAETLAPPQPKPSKPVLPRSGSQSSSASGSAARLPVPEAAKAMPEAAKVTPEAAPSKAPAASNAASDARLAGLETQLETMAALVEKLRKAVQMLTDDLDQEVRVAMLAGIRPYRITMGM